MGRGIAGLVVGLIVAAVVVFAPPAAAHTEVQSAEPGPAEEVSGPVDEVSLLFLSEIMSGATIEVSGPDGPVSAAGPVTLDADGRLLQVPLSETDTVGDYVVRYEFTAADGDHQEESYRFRIVDDGSSTVPVGAMAAVGAVVVGVGLALWRRRTAA